MGKEVLKQIPNSIQLRDNWPWLMLVVAMIVIFLCYENGWDWLIPLVVAVPASIAVFRSKPSNMSLAVVSLFLNFGSWGLAIVQGVRGCSDKGRAEAYLSGSLIANDCLYAATLNVRDPWK